MTASLSVLFTCVGRRVELVQAFRAAARRLGIGLRIVGLDNDLTAPALSCVDEPIHAPSVHDAAYVPAVLEAVRHHRADFVLPTIDTDLPILADRRAEIEQAGAVPLLPDSRVVAICRDKMETYRHLSEHGIDTPVTFTLGARRDSRTSDDVGARGDSRISDPVTLERGGPIRLPAGVDYPLFAKPRCGSASKGAQRVDGPEDLEYVLRRVPDLIFQELVSGVEHTLDVYVGLTGQPQCVVPRIRWQVRGGEVTKGVVSKDREVMAAGRRVAETLGRSVRGLVTLQCIMTPERRIRFIEINPRFGGGAPLSIAAGADFPGWLMQERLGQRPAIAFDGFQHGMCMLRYDWSVFRPLGADLEPAIVPPLRPAPDF